MDAVLSCMVTDSLGPGSLSDQLAGAVSDYLGIAGGIALRERTRAFRMALDHLQLPPGSAVVVDPLLPHAYFAVLAERGLRWLVVDVDKASLCMNVEQAERVVTAAREEGAAVGAIVTHTSLGFVPRMDELASLGVPIIEDISEGIGANTGSERVGRFGRFVIVAMEPDGMITAGGGSLLLAASRGDKNALRRAASELPSDALLPDMNAALGITQIKEIEKFIARRAEVASVYSRAIMRGRHSAPVQPGEAENVYLAFPVLVEGRIADVTAYARKKGVECRLAFESSALERYGYARREPSRVPGAAAEQVGGRHPAAPHPAAPHPAAPHPAASQDANADAAGEEAAADTADAGGAPERPSLHEADFPVARSLLLRCLVFPLYPSLTSKEVAAVERVLTTLP